MRQKLKIGIIAWTLCSCFFMYEFFLRVFTGSISENLLQTFDLNPNKFSFIGSSYYLAYALMQIPAGFMIARYGARKIGLTAVFLCVLGVFLFVFSYGYTTLIIARILMGLGSSFAFVNLLVVSRTYFPPRSFGFLAGSTQVIGNIGPILAGLPFIWLVHTLTNNWRQATGIAGIAGICLLILTYLFLDRNATMNSLSSESNQKLTSIWLQTKQLFQYKQSLFINIFAFLTYAAIPTVGTVWGVIYLQSHGYSQTQATGTVSLLWLGLAIGSPVVGFISDLLCKRKMVLILCAIVGLLISCLIITNNTHSQLFTAIIFFLLGFSGAAQTLTFVKLAELIPRELYSISAGVNNTAVMIGGLIVPQIVGFIINLLSKRQSEVYTHHNLIYGLAVLPMLYIIAIIIGFVLQKDTF